MTSKAYNYLYTLIGVICGYVIIKALFFIQIRPVRTDVIQGILIGFGMAIVTARIVAKLKATKVNGWTTMFRLSVPGNNMFMRAACALALPGPINDTARGDVLDRIRGWCRSWFIWKAQLHHAHSGGWTPAE